MVPTGFSGFPMGSHGFHWGSLSFQVRFPGQALYSYFWFEENGPKIHLEVGGPADATPDPKPEGLFRRGDPCSAGMVTRGFLSPFYGDKKREDGISRKISGVGVPVQIDLMGFQVVLAQLLDPKVSAAFAATCSGFGQRSLRGSVEQIKLVLELCCSLILAQKLLDTDIAIVFLLLSVVLGLSIDEFFTASPFSHQAPVCACYRNLAMSIREILLGWIFRLEFFWGKYTCFLLNPPKS